MEIKYEIPYENVVYFPGIVEDIDSLISDIESTNSFAISPWEVWYASSDTSGYAYGEVKFMSKNLLRNETDEQIRATSEGVISKLIEAMSSAAKTYAEIYKIDDNLLDYALNALNMEGTKYGINKYYENMYMGPHVDWNDQNSDITYTIVVYLNDDYEGGELYFVNPEMDLKIKPLKGSIVMFPSVLPYLHQSCEITKGRKMLITHHWKNDSLSKKA
jgi:predicted 2-oxoglutarate/Fe(II)-dependent dioxygenase YbiX